MDRDPGEITQLLSDFGQRDPVAADRLLGLLYDELHRLARVQISRQGHGLTLRPTALVDEAYMRLLNQHATWQNRAHFAGIAAQMMRRIVVDHARARKALKRGDASKQQELTPLILERNAGLVKLDEVLAVNQALERLREFDERQSRVVELRFFGGLSVDEIAVVLGVDRRTVQRDWQFARAWLHKQME